MKIKLILKHNLGKLMAADVNQRDYSTFKYYKPIIKSLYLKRIKIGLELLGNKKFSKMLNIGFGGGVILPELSKHAAEITGVDIHPQIDLVKQIIQDEKINNVKLIKADATSLPFADNKFDCVWCMSVLEFIPDSEKVIAEVKRVARDDATIIIGFPMTNKITDLAYKLVSFKNKDAHCNNHQILIQQIKKYFKIKKIKNMPGWLSLDCSLFCILKVEK